MLAKRRTGPGGRVGRVVSVGVATLALVVGGFVLTAGAAAPASKLPAACKHAINFCTLLSPMPKGGVLVLVASMPGANEGAVQNIVLITGDPTSVIAPAKLCHRLSNAPGPGQTDPESGGQNLMYRIECYIYAPVGHPAYVCLTSAAPILGGVDGVAPPNDPTAPASQWLGPPQIDGYDAGTVPGLFLKCPLALIAREHKAP